MGDLVLLPNNNKIGMFGTQRAAFYLIRSIDILMQHFADKRHKSRAERPGFLKWLKWLMLLHVVLAICPGD